VRQLLRGALLAKKKNPNSNAGALDRAFARLLSGDSAEINVYLDNLQANASIGNTRSISICHFLKLDGNGRPRTEDLAEFVASRVLDYAIPRSEIDFAKARDNEFNSTAEVSRLKKKADALFSGLKKSGEGGEVLLSILVQSVLGLPQLICKMPLKTNPQVHYHGADGIHAKFDEGTESIALYWGESKLYKSMKQATDDCIDSISEFLLAKGGSGDRRQRDLQLVTANIDLLDERLEDALLNYLNKNHPAYNKLQYRGVCLIGFDSGAYPIRPNVMTIDELCRQLKIEAPSWHEHLKASISRIQDLDTFEIHFFLIPFPSVEAFRACFLKELGQS
jgi:hypothetical protein